MTHHEQEELNQKFEKRKQADLVASIAIDVVGMASYLIPALAETTDLVLAPILAALIYAVHRTTFGAIAGFFEEIIPFTDIIPTATIIWFYRYVLNGKRTFNEFMSKFRNEKKSKDVIVIEDKAGKLQKV
jgi:hypothetical protein